MLTLLIVVVITALIFDYINGFHDAANAIATTVATGALSLGAAVTLAALFNFLGAVAGEEVAKTFYKGFVVNSAVLTQVAVLAARIGGIVWNLLTWWLGIPSSSSHALIGGLAGGVVAEAGFSGFIWATMVNKVLLWLVLSPLIGFLVASLGMVVSTWLLRRARPARVTRIARRAQIVSACAMAWSHGLSDAQKVMGVITLALLAYVASHPDHGFPTWVAPSDNHVPLWVKIACATAIALGTLGGGKRIIKTMGSKVARITPLQGFCAETSGALVLKVTAAFGIPVSTTHCINACILGAGASPRVTAVRWNVVANILMAWVITIPASGLVAWLLYFPLRAWLL